jgi:hypothetical protein
MAAPPAGESDTAGAPPAPAAESVIPQESAPAQEPVQTAQSTAAQMLAEEGSWKAKHDAMYGRLSAQIGELKQQVASLTQHAEALRQENAQLRDTLQAAKPSPAGASPASPDTGAVTDEYIRSVVPADQIEDYGIEYWRTQIAVLRSAVPQAQPANELREIKAELRRQREDEFTRTLTGLVPDWRAVNGSSQWLQFLGEVDRVTGYLNEELLRDAYSCLDPVRVAALFDRFKAGGAPAKRTVDDQISLPSRGGGGAPTSPNQTMTLAEWTAEMNKIVQTAMPPALADKRMKELRAIYEQGLADVPKAGAPPSGVW